MDTTSAPLHNSRIVVQPCMDVCTPWCILLLPCTPWTQCIVAMYIWDHGIRGTTILPVPIETLLVRRQHTSTSCLLMPSVYHCTSSESIPLPSILMPSVYHCTTSTSLHSRSTTP